MTYDPDEPTDLDQITGHPYVQTVGRLPSEWGDICAHTVDGWLCGFGVVEHGDAEPEVAATP